MEVRSERGLAVTQLEGFDSPPPPNGTEGNWVAGTLSAYVEASSILVGPAA